MKLTASILAAFLCVSCAKPVPPVPVVSVEGFDPEVRDAVQSAHQQAVAQPESGPASGRLGMVLHAHALYPTAALAYERAIRLEPKEFSWKYYLGLVQQQLSQPEKALDSFTAALRIRSEYAPAMLKRGDLLFQLGRFKDSGEAYESVLALDTRSAEALYGLARLKYAAHDLSAAEDLYRRACQAYPTFGAAYYGLGLVSRSQGNEAASIKNFEQAQAYGADRPPAADPVFNQIAQLATGIYAHLAQGDQLAHKGQAEQAARLNEEMLKRDPDNFTFVLNLLYLARFLDRFDDGELETLYAQAKRLDPQVPLIYDYHGAALARQGKYDAAAVALRKAIELNPESGEAHAVLAEILERQNRPAEAIDHYQRALAAQSSDRAVQMKLWRVLIIQGRGREAIPQLLPALKTDDSFSSLRLVLLGEAYRTTGEAGKARDYLEQARNRVRTEGPAGLLGQIDQELKELPSK
jgi:tetratricopeptide (TPR) repeat protein